MNSTMPHGITGLERVKFGAVLPLTQSGDPSAFTFPTKIFTFYGLTYIRYVHKMFKISADGTLQSDPPLLPYKVKNLDRHNY
jgi:hypothetical protein